MPIDRSDMPRAFLRAKESLLDGLIHRGLSYEGFFKKHLVSWLFTTIQPNNQLHFASFAEFHVQAKKMLAKSAKKIFSQMVRSFDGGDLPWYNP